MAWNWNFSCTELYPFSLDSAFLTNKIQISLLTVLACIKMLYSTALFGNVRGPTQKNETVL